MAEAHLRGVPSVISVELLDLAASAGAESVGRRHYPVQVKMSPVSPRTCAAPPEEIELPVRLSLGQYIGFGSKIGCPRGPRNSQSVR
jgi:hypothetical protein